jgi:hypothetical protein
MNFIPLSFIPRSSQILLRFCPDDTVRSTWNIYIHPLKPPLSFEFFFGLLFSPFLLQMPATLIYRMHDLVDNDQRDYA